MANWNGLIGLDGVKVVPLDEGKEPIARSHFGHGTLTFAFDCLFQTEPGVQVWVSGPTNAVKDAIQPLTGVVETEWLPFTFTVNWVFKRVNVPVLFQKDEPICTIMPISLSSLESVVPVVDDLKNNKELSDEYGTRRESRYIFNTDAARMNPSGNGWQRHYFRGETHGGRKSTSHRTKVSLRPFYS